MDKSMKKIKQFFGWLNGGFNTPRLSQKEEGQLNNLIEENKEWEEKINYHRKFLKD